MPWSPWCWWWQWFTLTINSSFWFHSVLFNTRFPVLKNPWSVTFTQTEHETSDFEVSWRRNLMSSCRNKIPMPLTYVVQNILYFKLKTSSNMIRCSSASFHFVLFCCSFQSAEASLKYLDPGYFLGKVCFMVTNGRATVKILLCVFLFVLFCFMFCFFPSPLIHRKKGKK